MLRVAFTRVSRNWFARYIVFSFPHTFIVPRVCHQIAQLFVKYVIYYTFIMTSVCYQIAQHRLCSNWYYRGRQQVILYVCFCATLIIHKSVGETSSSDFLVVLFSLYMLHFVLISCPLGFVDAIFDVKLLHSSLNLGVYNWRLLALKCFNNSYISFINTRNVPLPFSNC